ncbi:DeoR/GlpR family DNA-binding transcription regulator [Pseudogracilibacillus sp. ICA-222130]|uniref:DeoR/GlpR family DNA-binding transcription regulator n=1 Tax=Pseudogracilibacillus sp. ICA-222130 TaxID=3134655 RepID=UPI0030C56F12
MIVAERRLKIISYVNMYKKIRISDLSRLCAVSEETIRRDLKNLEEENYIIRKRGCAISIEEDNSLLSTPSFELNEQNRYLQLALKAIQLIRENDKVVLDNSKEAYYVAKYLPNITLTVITNSLKVILLLSEKNKITTMSVGGELQKDTLTYTRVLSKDIFNKLYFDKAFIACEGLDIKKGITVNCIHEAEFKKKIIQNVNKVYILLQSNKTNKKVSNKISNVTDIHGVITSNDMNKIIEKSLKNLKINLIYSQ